MEPHAALTARGGPCPRSARSWPASCIKSARRDREGARMDPNRLTQKSREALESAQAHAVRLGQVEVDAEHLLLALLEQEGGLAPRASSSRWAWRSSRCASGSRTSSSAQAQGQRRRCRAGQGLRHAAPAAAHGERGATTPSSSATSTSRSSTCCSRSWREPTTTPAGRRAARVQRDARAAARGAHGGARQPARDQRQARGHLRGARQVRARPRAGRARRQARSGDRARRRDPARDPHPLARAPRTTRC